MSANPGRIVGEEKIDLPYPRDRGSKGFTDSRSKLMRKFESLVTEKEDINEPQGEYQQNDQSDEMNQPEIQVRQAA